MSFSLHIYTGDLSKELIPKIKTRFLDLNMAIDFHPDFSFNKESDRGFLPFKLEMSKGHSKHYDNFGSAVHTGFEIYIDDFEYEKELKKVQSFAHPGQKQSLLSKIFSFGKKDIQNEIFISDKEYDQILKKCRKEIFITWPPQNKSYLRISLFFAAILAELTNGVVIDPQDARYFTGAEAIEQFRPEVEDYEQSFSPEQFHLEKFEGWD